MSRNSAAFKKDIIFRAIKWGFMRFTFKADDLFEELNPNKEEKEYLKNHFIAAGNRVFRGSADNTEETIFYTANRSNDLGAGEVNTWNKKDFSLTIEAKFKYIDFLELELARKNSISAKKYSQISIYIAIGALVVSAIGSIAQVISLFIMK